ncbi:hypothetical protein J6524_04920 [Bradyrhizobium sp. WSM 1738]|uniref:hypothetical protein n=1 Tax=Bradyrhizobium hereditatis TaxID=2821405 RepID=UPI001CE26C62|nr:hypothetical protein [Bradyrhizobium hereditatis]MCA6114271.1 hypothetical protein [Bradyrhizobium hereditatis]
MSDIVDRLRDSPKVGAYVQPTCYHSPNYADGRKLLNEAADEIERLRGDLRLARALIEDYRTAWNRQCQVTANERKQI